ncbi:ligase-associated DNA damage response endonuclease PdeM [Paracoccus aestuariivivens]|uniref:Ligase-associated DNA damage response endonuclease PdeM n=1 Tax=Paracoccus aestuariivivens TaxID=1820333 RepID=A0A6L6J4W4_9RHOB|nr:ligase-associated DNA damage response endonuclease PdeM [Paracoccus aestuariivivens]
MTGYPFDFHGFGFEARTSGALWWPEGRWLFVADLHFGKSERVARRGGALLPPYEGQATLQRLAAEIGTLDPRTVVCLGDSFDDLAAVQALDLHIARCISDLSVDRDWIWVVGNHDPAEPRGLTGRSAAELRLGPVTLRHCAMAGQGPDISGHFHPVVSLAGERRKAFVIGAEHLILPAFGTYTGGLICDDLAIRRLVPQGIAIACGRKAMALPLRARA